MKPPSKLTSVSRDEMAARLGDMLDNLENVAKLILITIDDEGRVKVALIEALPLEAADIMLKTADALMEHLQ